MVIKGLEEADFINYKDPCMFIASSKCDFKCCRESNLPVSTCQNAPLAQCPNYDISVEELFHRYISNDLTEAIVFGGMEPMLQSEDIFQTIKYFREHGCVDTFVIYTGYYENEVQAFLEKVVIYPNITIKFGRYIPGHQPHYDDVLGVKLASDNQYGKVVS